MAHKVISSSTALGFLRVSTYQSLGPRLMKNPLLNQPTNKTYVPMNAVPSWQCSLTVIASNGWLVLLDVCQASSMRMTRLKTWTGVMLTVPVMDRIFVASCFRRRQFHLHTPWSCIYDRTTEAILLTRLREKILSPLTSVQSST